MFKRRSQGAVACSLTHGVLWQAHGVVVFCKNIFKIIICFAKNTSWSVSFGATCRFLAQGPWSGLLWWSQKITWHSIYFCVFCGYLFPLTTSTKLLPPISLLLPKRKNPQQNSLVLSSPIVINRGSGAIFYLVGQSVNDPRHRKQFSMYCTYPEYLCTYNQKYPGILKPGYFVIDDPKVSFLFQLLRKYNRNDEENFRLETEGFLGGVYTPQVFKNRCDLILHICPRFSHEMVKMNEHCTKNKH